MTDQSRDDDFDALIAEGIERAEAERARRAALADADPDDAEPVEIVAEQDAEQDLDEPLRPAAERFSFSGPAFEVDDATFAAAVRAYEPVPVPGGARTAEESPTSGWSLAQEREEEPTVQMDVAELHAELAASAPEPVDAEEPADDPFAARTPSRRELREAAPAPTPATRPAPSRPAVPNAPITSARAPTPAA
ncbi:hypothetical protein [Agrococcus sp. HG114]|uniref:hypothetical protein n=1 Tax=Agrococcus sp. HG114 TaxID=2969757 RepID=UPI00215B4152|nr:hypothetical protein [Agrococcus sp. HG114]MCR8670868.1 hypothetical protein [Agrococcus sp. HG114]